jgi:hypothetical protein
VGNAHCPPFISAKRPYVRSIHHKRSDKLTHTWMLPREVFLFDCFRSCECAADCCGESVYGHFPFCKHFVTFGLGYDCTRIFGLLASFVGRATALSSPDIRHSTYAIVGHEKHVPDLQSIVTSIPRRALIVILCLE